MPKLELSLSPTEALPDETARTVKAAATLRIYPAPWKRKENARLLLACAKCQRKLKHGSSGVAKLKKALKKCARQDHVDDQSGIVWRGTDRLGANPVRLHVIQTPCLKLCPKGGVAVCTQAQAGRGECSIVRTPADVRLLYSESQREELNF